LPTEARGLREAAVAAKGVMVEGGVVTPWPGVWSESHDKCRFSLVRAIGRTGNLSLRRGRSDIDNSRTRSRMGCA
jgi:hypothetical protein